MQDKAYTADDLETLLYKQAGLLGVAGISSNDIRDLMASSDEQAELAIEMYCLVAARNLASLAVCLGGLETIIFTAGIGENSAQIRQKICRHINWLGVELDVDSNKKNSRKISTKASKVALYVIATNEDASIIQGIKSLLNLHP